MATVRATITLDEALYEQASEAARSLELSRSRLIATALREYLERRRKAQMLAALDEVYADAPDPEERRFLRGASASLRGVTEAEGGGDGDG